MSNADDRCARKECGASRANHMANAHMIDHDFVEPAPQPARCPVHSQCADDAYSQCRLTVGHEKDHSFEPQAAPSGDDAKVREMCICGPEWRNPECDQHGNGQMQCMMGPDPDCLCCVNKSTVKAKAAREIEDRLAAARAEAESIATRWVPAHMTARQGPNCFAIARRGSEGK